MGQIPKPGTDPYVSRTLLLIEDDEVDQMAFIRAMRELPVSYRYQIADSCAEGRQFLREGTFEVVVSDINLGDGTVFDIIDDIRSAGIPLIVTTGAGDQETAVRALQSGAIDYLIKDTDRSYLRMLPVSVERAILRAREGRLLTTLGAAVEQTHAAIAITSPDGIITYCNPGLITLFGADPCSLTGASLGVLFPEPHIYQEARRVADAGGVWSGEVATRHAHESITWELVSLSVITDKNGSPAGYLRIAEDISSRKHAEQALASEKERLAITLRSIGDGVIASSPDGNILYMNPRARELCGDIPDGIMPLILDQVFQPRDLITRERVPEESWPVDAGQTAETRRYLLDNYKKGGFTLIEQHISPLPLPDGTVGKVLVFRDITDMVRKEEESRRLSQLESLGLLAGGIAHDLNNVLTIIYSNLVMMRSISSVDEAVMMRISAAEQAVNRAKSLSKQFLTFSPGGEPIVEPLHLGPFLTSAPGGYVKGGEIQIAYDIPPDIPLVLADPGQLGVALHQITRNAIEAMPDSGRLAIRCLIPEPVPGGIPHVRIEIEDTGQGIPADVLPRVFEPYFSTKKEMKGLGLTTAHSIITQHKGTIGIRTTPGAGTCVTITLPVAEETGSTTIPDQIPSPSRGNRVLIMDDEVMILEILSLMLQRLGYVIETSKDGDEALTRYGTAQKRGEPYAMVIMDLIIPGGLGGKETIHLLREIDTDVPVMVSSGYSNDPVMVNYQEFGFNDSLPKPYNLKALHEKMNIWAPLSPH